VLKCQNEKKMLRREGEEVIRGVIGWVFSKQLKFGLHPFPFSYK